MKLNINGSKGYTGLGDIVTLAWLAQGARNGPDPIVFHRTRNLDLMALFRLAVDAEPGGITLEAAYEQELNDRGRLPRLEYLRQFLGLATSWERPPIFLTDESLSWADTVVRDIGAPPVLLFPQTAWKPREWPAANWVDLSWTLKAAGVPVAVFLQSKDERFLNTPRFWWGISLERIAALMQRAKLVVGADSFPAHLAGTIGTPTLALMGPTRPTIFAHAPNVQCLASRAIDCTGCHFRSPFRAACDQGCQSLFRLYPEDVRNVIQQELTRTGSRTDREGLQTTPGESRLSDSRSG